MISYDGLWKVMKERGISQYALINQYGISFFYGAGDGNPCGSF